MKRADSVSLEKTFSGPFYDNSSHLPTILLLITPQDVIAVAMRALLFTYFLFLWLPSTKSQGSRQCYWPDGTTTSSTGHLYLPCTNNGPSNCCSDGEACLSNGLCFGAAIGSVSCQMFPKLLKHEIDRSIKIYRGACTDSSWDNQTACPHYCNSTTSTTRPRTHEWKANRPISRSSYVGQSFELLQPRPGMVRQYICGRDNLRDRARS